MRFLIFAVLIINFISACAPLEENISEVEININDEVIQKIFTFRDRQEIDSLMGYFNHPDPVYRYLSALSFGSIQDTAAVQNLAKMLKDPTDIVRSAAAFAIGQTKAENSEAYLLEAFNRYDTSGYYKKANRAILEAIGKLGQPDMLENLSTITTYGLKDTTLLEGQLWGIYRFGLRNMLSEAGTKRMVEIATNFKYPKSVRLIAGNYLARFDVPLDTFKTILAQTYSRNEDPNIRMAMAIALGKARRQITLDTLLANFKREEDFRVKCNIIRSLGNFEYGKVQPTLVEALNDENIHVAKRAAQFFIEHGIPEDATFYRRKAKEVTGWPVEIALYAAANKYLPAYFADYRGLINYDLRRKFKQASSPYERVAVVDAMAEYPWNYRTIHQFGIEDTTKVVQAAVLNAFSKISSSEKFQPYFGQSIKLVTRELFTYFLEAIQSGDVGKTAIASIALRNPDRAFNTYLDSLDVLTAALGKLDLPKEIEAYNELKATIDLFEGEKEFEPHRLPYNHPINWSVLDKVNNQTRAAIQTSKGTITIRLLPDVAPGTVANFIQLAKDDYFTGKNFHRVVPNFVIQGGCTRGDGFGSLDYSIRSELSPLHYNEEGFVGMASAGNHTEGTQFFITHSPTPHLDGLYTIFAKVVTEESMDVVFNIQPGDEIQSVAIR